MNNNDNNSEQLLGGGEQKRHASLFWVREKRVDRQILFVDSAASLIEI